MSIKATDHTATVEQLVIKNLKLQAANRQLQEELERQNGNWFDHVFELNCRLVETKSRAAEEKEKLKKELEEMRLEKEKLLVFKKQVEDAVRGYGP